MANDQHLHPNIIIDKKHFRATENPMTGSQLKVLGGVPGNMRLFRDNPGPEPDEPIGDGESVTLHEGDHFYSLPPGKVGFLPSVQAEIEEVASKFPEAVVHRGVGIEFWLEIPNVSLPATKGWTVHRGAILLPVPANYPTSRPPNFYVSPDVGRATPAAGFGGAADVLGKKWMPVCWAPEHSEHERRDLLACVRFALARFQEAQ